MPQPATIAGQPLRSVEKNRKQKTTGITCLNAAFAFEGLRIASGIVHLATLGAAGSKALVLLLLDAQHNGLLVAQIFFGLWLVPLGYLAYRSTGGFSRWPAVLPIVDGICYLVEMLTLFLLPDLGQKISTFVVIPAALAEISMVVYPLVLGVQTVRSDKPILNTQ